MGSAEKMVEQRDATSNGTDMQGTPIVILPWVVVVGSMSIELVPSTQSAKMARAYGLNS